MSKEITAKTHANLLFSGPGGQTGFSQERRLRFDAEVVTVADVIAALGIDPGQVGVIKVGERLVAKDTVLEDGAQVDLFPFFGGG